MDRPKYLPYSLHICGSQSEATSAADFTKNEICFPNSDLSPVQGFCMFTEKWVVIFYC